MEIFRKFGLDQSIYQDYQVKKKEYEKALNEYKEKLSLLEKHYLINIICSVVFLFIYFNIFKSVLGPDNWKTVNFEVWPILNGLINLILMIVYLCIVYLPIVVIGWFCCSEKVHNFISGGKYYKLKAEKKELEQEFLRLTEGIKNKVSEKEKALRNYYLNWLEDFRNENLFRKNSGSAGFEESLLKYSSMINVHSDINKVLITTSISYWDLSSHVDYLKSRTNNIETTKILGNQRIGVLEKEAKNALETKHKLKVAIVPPEIEYKKSKKVNSAKLPSSFVGRKIDWKALSESQRLTGESGEELVFELEKDYLCVKGRSDLAERVCRMSKEKGDGLGYDILSFSIDGKEKYIEVKSTTSSIESSFYMSKNELSFLESHKDDSYVYRIALAKEAGNSLLQVFPSNNFLEISERTPIMFRVQM